MNLSTLTLKSPPQLYPMERVVFIDDVTRYAEVFFWKEKPDVTNKWKVYCQRIFIRTGKYPHSIKTYSSTEYVNSDFNAFCETSEVRHLTTAPYAHSPNDVAE